MNRAATLALAPLSGLYGIVVKSGNTLYRRRFFHTHKIQAPVISVGNLTTGGTGKTPLVEWIAKDLARSGRRPCILTRGYLRESSGRVLVSGGKQILADVSEAGDEAFLLAKNLEHKAAVICDADRVAAARWASRNLNCDVFILDDGFQHQRIARDLNILVIDATNPWGNGRLLPAGILREPRNTLSRADCVVITRTDSSERVAELQNEIETISPAMPVFRSSMELASLQAVNEPAASMDVDVRRVPVAAFCAIGNPNSFFSLLTRNGHQLTDTRSFRDHHKYTQSDMDRIVREARARGAQAILTTAKDAVKLGELKLSVPCYAAEIEIKLNQADQFRELISEAIASS